MGLFQVIYKFFRNNKLLFTALNAVTIILAVYAGSRIVLEEDISKSFIGENEKTSAILRNSQFVNKLIINIFNADSLKSADPGILTAFADELTDSLKTDRFSKYLMQSTLRIDESVASGAVDMIYDNLPIFLEDKDYIRIDSLLTEESITNSLEKNFRTLISPAGFGLKKYILKDPTGISAIALLKMKQLRTEENFDIVNGYILGNNKKNLLLFLNPVSPASETRQNAALFRKLDKLLETLQAKHGNSIKAEYFGSPAIAVGNADQIKKDIAVTVTVAIIAILLFVGFFFRSKFIPFISFLPAVFGGIIALALIYLIKGKISTIGLSIGSVLLGIIVDYALYFYSLYGAKKSVSQVLKDISLPLILCSVTSSVAFFSLLLVKSEVLKDLGLFAGFSILGAAFFALVILPQLIGKESDQPAPEKGSSAYRIFSNESNVPRYTILVIIAVTILMIFFNKGEKFETDMNSMNYLSPNLKRAEKDLGKVSDLSLKSIYVFSAGKDLDQALSVNTDVAEVLRKLKEQKIIKNYTNAGVLLINDSTQRARIQKWNNFWSGDRKEKVKNIILKKGSQAGFNKTAFSGFFSTIDKDFTPAGPEAFNAVKTLFLNDMIALINGKYYVMSMVKVNNADRPEVASALTGEKNVIILDTNELTNRIVDDIRKDFSLLVNLCLIFVTLTLIIAMGRFETGLIAAIPMLVSWVWTLGFMGITGIKFNIFNIIVSTFIFGLGVDYSILMMQGLLLEYKYGQKDLSAYKTSIFLSSATTIIGVGVLILARHPALNSIAIISVIGLLNVVLLSFLLEPVLFRWLVRKKGKRRTLPLTIKDILSTIIALSTGLLMCIMLNLLFFIVFPLPLSSKIKRRILHRGLYILIRIASYGMISIKTRTINETNEDFNKPAVIIANHQSHLDLPLLLSQSHKIIVLTTSWVWNNPVYALVIRYLGFYSVTNGYELLIDKLRKKAEEGYSILVFPEGTRSPDSSIKRFHKGAFLLAEKLNLDILPVVIHGAGYCMTKGENHLKSGTVTLKILPRIKPDDPNFGNDYHERTKALQKYLREEFRQMRQELETPQHFRKMLIRNYIYKGPVLEWYVRVKLHLEKSYTSVNKVIPRDAFIVDIGCGYGLVSYMLGFTSGSREILGIDYDADKIRLAENCISRTPRINFVSSDALNYAYPEADVFILYDMLHYIPEDKQEELLGKCIERLKPGGIIIIRDADTALKKRHLGTRYTEFFSTRSGFNKSVNRQLYFFSSEKIREIAAGNNMKLETIDETNLTSNILYLLRKQDCHSPDKSDD